MRFGGSENHMICGMVVMLGIFAVLVMSTVVPQSALSQSVSPSGTNQSSSAEMNIPSNATILITGPGVLLDGGIVIQGPSGDDNITKNCLYASRVFSPGSVVEMSIGGGGTVVKFCHMNGTWVYQ